MISISKGIANSQKIKGLKSFLSGVVKIFVGALLCQSPLTAPLVMGWMSLYMRSKTVQLWVSKSPIERPSDFYDHNETKSFSHWPNWFRLENNDAVTGKISRLRHALKKYLGSIVVNYKAGFIAFFNIWFLSLPFCLIWLLMWWAGVDMAFNNSDEGIALAPAVSIISIILFSLLMMFLPIAQARQALHQDWKSFFDFKTIAVIVRHAQIRLFLLALFFAAASFGLIYGTKIIPTFFEPVYAVDMDNAQAVRDSVEKHYMRVALLFFAILICLKRMSARIYALALLKAIRAHALKPEQLTPLENNILFRKLHYKVDKEPHCTNILSSDFPKAIKWSARHLNNITFFSATLMVWAVFVFTIYLGQFFNIHPADWLNHPLIHMPYIRVPSI